MYNLTDEIYELDLLIESAKEEFNDYAESLLSEYSFDEVESLLESAHFEAELVITEAEDEQANKIKENGNKAKKKVEEKFNSPSYKKKCKEIEEAIKADPSIGEQRVVVPAVDKICKKIVSSAKNGKEIDNATLSQTETITLKQLMLKRKRIQTIIGVTIGAVSVAAIMLVTANIVTNIQSKDKRGASIINKVADREAKAMTPGMTDEYNKLSSLREHMTNQFNHSRKKAMNKAILLSFIGALVGLATAIYGVIMDIKIHKINKDIENGFTESYFDSF